MSEEAQNRVDEDFESEEGDLESYLEEESSSELLERVKELQVSESYASTKNRFAFLGSVLTSSLNISFLYRLRTLLFPWQMRVREKHMSDAWTRWVLSFVEYFCC